MLLQQKTSKLFYNKWPYKITCKLNGAHLIRRYKKDFFINDYFLGSSLCRGPEIDIKNLKEFVSLSKNYFCNKDIKLRIDFYHVDFYVLTKDVCEQLMQTLKKYVTAITEPADDEELKILLENKKYNLCKRLPHGKYQYKITFKDMPVKTRNDLISWAEKYSDDEIYIPKSTRNYFKAIKHHYGSHYFYVKDQKLITLVLLASGGAVRRTDEYVIRNTQEEA